MEVRDLIAHFATCEIIPIDVQDDVVPILQAHSDFDVWFWTMPLETGIYRGMMTQWEEIPWGNGKVRTHISIQIADGLSSAWQRLICCKELIHILDPVELRVSNEAALHRLIDKIVLPPEMQDLSDGPRVWNDRLAIWQALAILFPWATRELYLEKFNEGKISLDEISEEVDLPIEYVAVVMNESWAEQYHLLARM